MMKAALLRLKIDTLGRQTARVPVLLLSAWLPLSALAQHTPAGTTVSNQVALDFQTAGVPRQAVSNIDTFTVQELIDVAISKSAEVIADGRSCNSTPCDPVPGATIRYTLQVDVTGSGTAENLVITDSIPANTQYIPASLTLDSTPLTDGTGDDPGSFSGNLVSIGLGNVNGPASFVITLDVTIN